MIYAKLTSRIPEVIGSIEARTEAVDRATAAGIAADAATRVPVRTGFLKSTIEVYQDEALVEAEYAPFVEYGTRYMDAEPYLRPAADEAEHGYVEAQRAALERL